MILGVMLLLMKVCLMSMSCCSLMKLEICWKSGWVFSVVSVCTVACAPSQVGSRGGFTSDVYASVGIRPVSANIGGFFGVANATLLESWQDRNPNAGTLARFLFCSNSRSLSPNWTNAQCAAGFSGFGSVSAFSEKSISGITQLISFSGQFTQTTLTLSCSRLDCSYLYRQNSNCANVQ